MLYSIHRSWRRVSYSHLHSYILTYIHIMYTQENDSMRLDIKDIVINDRNVIKVSIHYTYPLHIHTDIYSLCVILYSIWSICNHYFFIICNNNLPIIFALFALYLASNSPYFPLIFLLFSPSYQLPNRWVVMTRRSYSRRWWVT